MSRPLEIVVRAFQDRRYLAELEFSIHGIDQKMNVSAMSEPESGMADPEPGTYQWVKTVNVKEEGVDAVKAYGPKIAFFKNERTGNVLAVHGGMSDLNGELLSTEGGIRLSNDDLMLLCGFIEGRGAVLRITEEKLGFMAKWSHPKVSRSRPYRMVRGGREIYDEELNIGDFVFWYWLFFDDQYTSPEAEFVPGGGDFGGGGVTGDVPLDAAQVDKAEAEPLSEPVSGNPVEKEAAAPDPLIVDPFVAEAAPLAAAESITVSPEQHSAPDSPGTAY